MMKEINPDTKILEPSKYEIFGKPIHRYDYNMFTASETLISGSKGTCECSPFHMLVFYYFLMCRLEDWHDSCDWDRRVDDSVKNLCRNACKFYYERNYNRDKKIIKNWEEADFPQTEQERCLTISECLSKKHESSVPIKIKKFNDTEKPVDTVDVDVDVDVWLRMLNNWKPNLQKR